MAKVRVATEADIEALVLLGERLYEESSVYYEVHDFSRDKTALSIRGLMGNSTCLVLIAEQDGEAIGYLGGYCTPQFFGYTKTAGDFSLYVAPEYRGGSAFFRLLQHFEEWATGQGAVDLAPGISTELNLEAVVSCYERLGYRRSGVILRKRIR